MTKEDRDYMAEFGLVARDREGMAEVFSSFCQDRSVQQAILKLQTNAICEALDYLDLLDSATNPGHLLLCFRDGDWIDQGIEINLRKYFERKAQRASVENLIEWHDLLADIVDLLADTIKEEEDQ